MGFEPPKAITLHLIVFKMLESIIRQGFYAYSASPNYQLSCSLSKTSIGKELKPLFTRLSAENHDVI
jgi:hypothetical protein